VLYNSNIPNLKLLFGLRTGKLVTHLIYGLNGPWWFAMNLFQALRKNTKMRLGAFCISNTQTLQLQLRS
jgi:hypothetical protein